MSELSDKIIGGFRVLQEIQVGAGSQGTVYKAVCEDPKLASVRKGTLVALKVMAVQDDAKQQWKKLENRTTELCRLNHPNVVRYHGCFSESGLFNDVHVVVQEYLDGETLKECLARLKTGLDVDVALKIADASLAGLEYISRCGIVHRDIKPGNIFLCRDGSVKLIDFEIAKQRGGTTTSTAGNIRGSFDYMAPDFTDADFHGDEMSDVFSMAVVVHEMLTGKTPYQRLEGEGKQANFAFLSRWSRALSDGANPIYVSSRVKRLLANATEVLEKALSPKREERYSGFSEFRTALKKVKFRTLRNGDRSYKMLQFIGKGGFGEVFKARRRDNGEFVAVKHLLKANYAERFYREAKIMKKLNDPCFVRLVDFFTLDVGNSREAFLVMAFLDGMPGCSLRDAIRGAGGRLDPHDVFTAFERYAHGLSVMHASGIFHRDIKPSNLYYPSGDVASAAIMDLGIARDVNGTATHGQVPGTLDYMPPEVVLTDNRGDGGMDVYALGLCLYEALTGKTAYPRLPTGTASYTAFFERARSKLDPVFSDKSVATDHELLSLLRDMTNPDQALRIKDAAAVAVRIGSILHSRFGGAKVSQKVPCDDSPATVATAVVADPTTNATVATQWGGLDELHRERVRVRRKRIWMPLAMLSVFLGVGGYFAWSPVMKLISDRSRNAAAISEFEGRIAQCIRPNGQLHEGNFAELEKVDTPKPERVVSALSDQFASLGKAISAAVRANLEVEPPLTRRSRIARAKKLLEGKWVAVVLSPGEVSMLRREIDNAAGWCVSIVKNGCAGPISVDGSEIPAGGSKVMVYEDGHPENGIVSRSGFKPIHLPKGIDGKVHEIVESAFVAKPVRFNLPAFDGDVRCELGGRSRNSGETVELMPGYYTCRYLRDNCKPQEVSFSVYANAEVKVPRPGEWEHTDEFLERERKRQREMKKLAVEERKRIEKRKGALEKTLKGLLANEPVETRRKRLYEAEAMILGALKDRTLEEPEANAGMKAVEERRKWIVGKVRNAGDVDVTVGGRRIAPASEELMVFKDGLPGNWVCTVPGYEEYPVPKDFDGRTVEVSASLMNPSPVNVKMAPLEHGVVCLFDGAEVKGSLRLKPGRHSCVYRKNGYRDQAFSFDVELGTDRSLPVPGSWQAEPVAVAIPVLQDGVLCRVDGSPAGRGLMLAPGEHVCVYSREDYDEQRFSFTVAPATEASLPPPGTWSASPGLKRLDAAEAAVKEGNWTKAKAAIAFADVTSEVNVSRKKRIGEIISNQSRLAEKREQAELYYEEGLFFDAVKYYSEAVDTGYVLSEGDLGKFKHSYDTAKRRLQVMIDRCHKDIALGKSPIRPLADLEAEMRHLIEWNSKVRGRK